MVGGRNEDEDEDEDEREMEDERERGTKRVDVARWVRKSRLGCGLGALQLRLSLRLRLGPRSPEVERGISWEGSGTLHENRQLFSFFGGAHPFVFPSTPPLGPLGP